MIIDNFFPTNESTKIVKNVGTFEFSKTFATALTNPGTTYIDNNDTTFNDAYWLGWIRPENVPTALRISDTTYDSQADKFTFTDSTELQNFNIGYAATLGVNYTDFHNASILKYSSVRDSVTEKWKCMPEASEEYFTTRAMLNQFYIGCVNFSRLVVTYTAVKAGIPYNTLKYVDAADFEDWKTADVEITVEGGASKTISNAALNESNYIQDDGYNIFISAYRAEIDDCVDNNLQQFTKIITTPVIDLYATGKLPNNEAVTVPHEVLVSGMASPYLRAYDAQDYKTFEITELYGRRNNCVYYATSGYDSGHSNVVIDRRDGAGGNIFYAVVNGFTGDFESMMNKQQASQIGGWSGFWPNSNTCFGVMSGTLVFCRMYTPEDIVRHMSLMPRWKAHAADAPSYGVVSGVYYPEVLDSGEFTGKLITGTVAQLYAKLQPWQYEEITENEYSADDLPPYEPPGPGDNSRSDGDENLPNRGFVVGSTDGFITMYAMTAYQLSQLSDKLWASFTSSAFWESVAVAMYNDFSIDPAHILDYVVSLRMYPLDLKDLNDATTLTHDWLYFGRGAYPLELDSGQTLYSLGSYSETFDGGTVEVPRWHNDFRDYEPFTRIILTVPFCGSVELTPSEVVGFNLRLSYMCDFSTGVLQATCWVQSEVPHIVATLSGSIGATVQMSASSNMEFLQKMATAVVPAATAAFAGGIGLSAGAIGMAGSVSGVLGAEEGVVASAKEAYSGGSETSANLMSQIHAPDVSSSPVHVFGMSAGFSSMQITKAFISVQRRYYEIPGNYYRVYGRACNYSTTLENVSGFTVCKNVEVDTLKCTVDEQIRIKQLLETGVFL